MPAYFEQGFMVREPAWHGLGVVLDDYPGREEAMRLAGHNFELVECPVYVDLPLDPDAAPVRTQMPEWKAIVKEMVGDDSHGQVLHVTRETYVPVGNSIGWDIVDAIVGEGARYETGITLKGGAVCSVLAWLDEPTQIAGDDSPILPWVNVSWTHDGSGAVTARATSIRTVCWNTQSASELEGKRLNTDFTFRHTKNVMARIEDAKLALKGVRLAHQEYVALAEELAQITVTENQRDYFVEQFFPLPPEALISDRVRNNIEGARSEMKALFNGPSIPEAHRLTGYGLQLAGVEYLDHLRGYRNQDTLYGRQLLRNEPAKAKITSLIKECVAL